MARGSSSGDSNLQLFFMKITGLKDGEAITIKQTQAVEKGKHIELDETVQDVSGQLHKVEVREYTPRPNEKAQELKIWLKDAQAGEMYAVSCNMNSIGRSIINTILAIEPPYGQLMLRVYNKKDTGYPAVYITHNDVRAGWKYTIDELKPHIVESKVRENGVMKVKKDYWDLNQFLINDLNTNVVPKLTKVPSKFQDGGELQSDIQVEQTDETMVAAPEDVEDPTDDLPF